LIVFTTINFETVLLKPSAILTYHTDALFFDPISTGVFTVQIDYGWSLSNTHRIQYQLEVINPCHNTLIIN
jgi:hypothetical protein